MGWVRTSMGKTRMQRSKHLSHSSTWARLAYAYARLPLYLPSCPPPICIPGHLVLYIPPELTATTLAPGVLSRRGIARVVKR